MDWGTINNELSALGGQLQKIMTAFESPSVTLTPILRLNPPSARPSYRSAAQIRIANLEEPWERILAIEAQVLTLKERLSAQRAAERNILSPVFALPEEVLRDVFKNVWLASEGSLVISGVCKYWRNIAIQHRILSTKIPLRNPDDLKTLLRPLQFSHPFPVDITLVQPRSSVRRGPSDAEEAVCQMLADRLKTLSWKGTANIWHFIGAASLYQPQVYQQLESISLELDMECPTCRTPAQARDPPFDPLNLHKLPRLASLALENVHMGVSVLEVERHLNTLTSLTLCNCTVSPQSMAVILRHTPRLENLEVSHLVGGGQAFFNPGFSTSFVHGALKTIKLVDVPHHTICGVLFNGRYPNLKSLTVHPCRLDMEVPSPTSFASCLPPERPGAYPLQRSLYHTVCIY